MPKRKSAKRAWMGWAVLYGEPPRPVVGDHLGMLTVFASKRDAHNYTPTRRRVVPVTMTKQRRKP